ncbi:hypothetical protein J6590_004635 [Homalodisca vitripennis]|nr:hypothetical protein J6590_004635 [Homalodisca vitripennis]
MMSTDPDLLHLPSVVVAKTGPPPTSILTKPHGTMRRRPLICNRKPRGLPRSPGRSPSEDRGSLRDYSSAGDHGDQRTMTSVGSCLHPIEPSILQLPTPRFITIHGIFRRIALAFPQIAIPLNINCPRIAFDRSSTQKN